MSDIDYKASYDYCDTSWFDGAFDESDLEDDSMVCSNCGRTIYCYKVILDGKSGFSGQACCPRCWHVLGYYNGNKRNSKKNSK